MSASGVMVEGVWGCVEGGDGEKFHTYMKRSYQCSQKVQFITVVRGAMAHTGVQEHRCT